MGDAATARVLKRERLPTSPRTLSAAFGKKAPMNGCLSGILKTVNVDEGEIATLAERRYKPYHDFAGKRWAREVEPGKTVMDVLLERTGRLDAINRLLPDLLRNLAGRRILDLACGCATVVESIAARRRIAQTPVDERTLIVANDASISLFEVATRRLTGANDGSEIVTTNLDPTEMFPADIVGDGFDDILWHGEMHTAIERSRVMAVALCMLKPGGTLHLIDVIPYEVPPEELDPVLHAFMVSERRPTDMGRELKEWTLKVGREMRVIDGSTEVAIETRTATIEAIEKPPNGGTFEDSRTMVSVSFAPKQEATGE